MDNEYTVYDNKPNNSQMADNEQTQLDNNAAFRANNAWREHKNRRQCPTWVKVAGGAGAGLLIGTAASILFTPDVQAQTEPEPTLDTAADTTSESEQAQETSQEENGYDYSQASTTYGNGVSMATGVNDSMSFNEAFAAARAEVGPGGVFEWKGNLYGTYYEDEWNNMTAEQRDEYNSHFSWSGGAEHQDSYANNEAEVVSTNEDALAQNGEDEPEVEVLGVVYDDETGTNIGAMTIDGQDVYLIDVDPGEGETFDFLAADFNNDGQITEDEIIDIQDQQITASDLGGVSNPAMDPNDELYAQNSNLPDYVNDADTADYVG